MYIVLQHSYGSIVFLIILFKKWVEKFSTTTEDLIFNNHFSFKKNSR